MSDDMVNEWTRDDLPSVIKSHRYGNMHFSRIQEVEAYKDDVVDHLNAHHPKPDGDLHSTVLRQAGHVHDLIADLADMERERDEWKARAEAADARTAPAVTKADIEKAIRSRVADRSQAGENFIGGLLDAVHALVSGDDPAVFVVRESDVAAVEVTKRGSEWSTSEACTPSVGRTSAEARETASNSMRVAIECEAIARAIEAGQAVDPLLDKAQEFAALADWELTDREAELLHTVARHVLGQEAGQ